MACVQDAIAEYRKLGAETVEISLPNMQHGVAAYYVIAPAEASSNLSRFDGVRYGYRAPEYGDLADMYQKSRAQGFGAEVKRRILIGTYVLSHGYYDAYYLQAQRIRRLIADDFVEGFQAMRRDPRPDQPSAPLSASARNRPTRSRCTSRTSTPSPSISPDCPHVDPQWLSAGLPVGLQLIGDYFAEARLLNVAHRYQQATDWHLKTPKEAHARSYCHIDHARHARWVRLVRARTAPPPPTPPPRRRRRSKRRASNRAAQASRQPRPEADADQAIEREDALHFPRRRPAPRPPRSAGHGRTGQALCRRVNIPKRGICRFDIGFRAGEIAAPGDADQSQWQHLRRAHVNRARATPWRSMNVRPAAKAMPSNISGPS